MNKERVRMDEDTDLKSAGPKGFGGSSPSPSAKKVNNSPSFFLTYIFISPIFSKKVKICLV